MAYSNGNLALQPKRKPDQKQVVKETTRVLVKRKPLPVQEKLLYLGTIAIFVVVAGLIIFRYSEVYQLNLKVKALNNEYNDIAVQMKDLHTQVQALSDPDRIKQIAEMQGMVPQENAGIKVQRSGSEQSNATKHSR